MKVYTFRLYPNKQQYQELDRLLEASRNLYNFGLEDLINHYKKTGKYLNRFAQDKKFNKKTVPDLPAQITDTVVARLHRSFANFFRGLKTSDKVGFPRFQSFNRWHSFSFRDYKFGGRIIDSHWRVRKDLQIKVKLHRKIEGEPKFTRCVKKVNKFYIQVICKSLEIKPREIKKGVGLDLGLRYFVADNKGNKVNPPKFFREHQYKLARSQRKLSKKVKGSNRRSKQKALVAKHHLKIVNQRQDWLHKLSREYANNYDYVVMEKLNIRGMIKNRHLALSISDASWGLFQSLLAYKLKTLGGKLVLVNPKYTSQVCSKCGAIVKKSLSTRTHVCPECLFVDDRDTNAAKNIFALGKGIVEATQ